MTTRELWNPTGFDPKASRGENERVRTVYLTEKLRVLGPGHPLGHKCGACGDFRGDLARDWVEVAQRSWRIPDVELRVPGADWRKELREGETVLERRVDAARTRIRQFEKGKDQREWVLVGIETTICDRNDWAYPGGAYNSQRRLPI